MSPSITDLQAYTETRDVAWQLTEVTATGGYGAQPRASISWIHVFTTLRPNVHIIARCSRKAYSVVPGPSTPLRQRPRSRCNQAATYAEAPDAPSFYHQALLCALLCTVTGQFQGTLSKHSPHVKKYKNCAACREGGDRPHSQPYKSKVLLQGKCIHWAAISLTHPHCDFLSHPCVTANGAAPGFTSRRLNTMTFLLIPSTSENHYLSTCYPRQHSHSIFNNSMDRRKSVLGSIKGSLFGRKNSIKEHEALEAPRASSNPFRRQSTMNRTRAGTSAEDAVEYRIH